MTASKRSVGSNLKKVDARAIRPAEYDEAPELDAEWFAKATMKEGGKVVRRGRPKSENPKLLVSLRIDSEVVAAFKGKGAGWQSRMNAALRAAAFAEEPASRLKAKRRSV